MVRRRPSICVAALWRLLDLAQERGISSRAAAHAAGMTAEQLDRTSAAPIIDRRVSFTINDAVWDHVMGRLRDPGLPIDLARPSRVEHFNLFGFLLKTSPTVAAAAERARRYLAIWTDRGALTLESAGDTASIVYRTYENETTIGARCSCEAVLADMASLLRQLVADSALRIAVSFTHARPNEIDAHERFFRAPVHFGATRNSITFPAGLLERALPGHDAGMLSYFEGQAEGLLAALPTSDQLTVRASRAISDLLPNGEASLDRVGKAMAMSGRTLRRHLADQGTTFDDLLMGVRRELAERYLRDTRLSIAEVALLLGFSEQASFHRAYRRWTGKTPGAARAQVMA